MTEKAMRGFVQAVNGFQAGAVALAELERGMAFKLRRPKRERYLTEKVRAEFAKAEAAMNRYALQAAIRDGAVEVMGGTVGAGGLEIRDSAGRMHVSLS